MISQRGAYRTKLVMYAVADIFRIRPRNVIIAFVLLIVTGFVSIGAYAAIASGGDILGFVRSTRLFKAIAGEGAVPQEIPANRDIGLALYNNPKTKTKVIGFFSDLTGSQQIATIITSVADKYNVPLSLAFALAWKESNFSSVAVNYNGGSVDRGLYQLNSLSFPRMTVSDFFDPEQNAERGLRYLSQCLDAGGNEIVGLAMYNAGMSRVVADGTPRATLDYISTILKYQNQVNAEFETALLHPGSGGNLLAKRFTTVPSDF